MRPYLSAIAGFVATALSTGVTAADYGPDTCKQGYVWREAYRGDRVCVKPEVRAQAAEDNKRAASRRQPGGGAYGPDTCRQGYVWREAHRSDHVCVTPGTREQTARDNQAAAGRRVAKGGIIDHGTNLVPVQ